MVTSTVAKTMGQKQYWNIVKGLGIAAIVIGHTGGPITAYLYMYHVALFFFVAGYFYNEKYSAAPFDYFAARLRSLWWPFVMYGVTFSLLHNIFLHFNVYSSVSSTPGITPMNKYSIYETFTAAKKAVFMHALEEMAGAMWFVFALIISMFCFCFIRRISLVAKGRSREILAALLILTTGAFGIWLFNQKIQLEYRSDVALLVLPIVYSGFMMKKSLNIVPLKWYLALISVAAVVLIYRYNGTSISLAGQTIISPTWFFIASLAGIYFNLYLAKLIQFSPNISHWIAEIGENSFHIMALHFLAFKVPSLIYVMIFNKPYYWIAKFPFIDAHWWVIYAVFGIVLPVALVKGSKKIKDTIKIKYKTAYSTHT